MYSQRKNGWTKHFDFLVIDLICLQISFISAYILRNGFGNPYTEYNNAGRLISVLCLLKICIVFFQNPYSSILKRGILKEIQVVITSNLLLMVGIFTYLFAIKASGEYSRIMLFAMIGFNIVYECAGHFIRKWFIQRGKKTEGKRKMILVVKEQNLVKSVERLKDYFHRTAELSGVILWEDQVQSRFIEGIPILGGKNQLIEYCRTHVVDDVLFDVKGDSVGEYMSTLTGMGVIVYVNIAALEQSEWKYQVVDVAGMVTLTASINTVNDWQLAIKRLMDIAGGIVGLFLTGILTVFLAPVIKLQSPGPVFFSQMRVGKNGRLFKIYKFRSMYTDAEERKKELMEKNKMSGLMFKMDDDPRVFPFGKFIRKTSLDEFPQFWNVLTGSMSLCGTRPPTVDEYEQYAPHHKGRLAMKPGLTGLWQISGRSDITDFEEVVRLDNEYIRNWSLSLDIKIIWKTIWVVLGRRGAE